MRDFQRAKLYAWEGCVLVGMQCPYLSLTECNDLARNVWSNMRAKGSAPKVRTTRTVGGAGFYNDKYHLIYLPECFRSPWYTLHELTHALGQVGHHGNFCALYARLLERFDGWVNVRASMREFGLVVAS
jgi:hypothetical protein